MRVTRSFIKWCSFFFSTVYTVLLTVWLVPGLHDWEMVFGFMHGIGWFFMVALSLYGLHARLIDMRLALAIAVLGAVGPYFGSAEFIYQDRVRARRQPA
jgi:hypothetical protein